MIFFFFTPCNHLCVLGVVGIRRLRIKLHEVQCKGSVPSKLQLLGLKRIAKYAKGSCRSYSVHFATCFLLSCSWEIPLFLDSEPGIA